MQQKRSRIALEQQKILSVSLHWFVALEMQSQHCNRSFLDEKAVESWFRFLACHNYCRVGRKYVVIHLLIVRNCKPQFVLFSWHLNNWVKTNLNKFLWSPLLMNGLLINFPSLLGHSMSFLMCFFLSHKRKTRIFCSSVLSILEVSLIEIDPDQKPTLILDYNAGKGGFGQLDQNVSEYIRRRKTVSWPIIVLYNTYLWCWSIQRFSDHEKWQSTLGTENFLERTLHTTCSGSG